MYTNIADKTMNEDNKKIDTEYGYIYVWNSSYKSSKGRFMGAKISIVTGNTFQEFQQNLTKWNDDPWSISTFYNVTPFGVVELDDIPDFWCEENANGDSQASGLWWDPNQEGTIQISRALDQHHMVLANSLNKIVPLLTRTKPQGIVVKPWM